MGHFYWAVLTGAWSQLHQTWREYRAITNTQEICFRFSISCCIFKRGRFKVEWFYNNAKFRTFITTQVIHCKFSSSKVKCQGHRVKGQGHSVKYCISSKNAIIQRLQTWHGVVIKAEKDLWRGSGSLKLQCIRNCHIFTALHEMQTQSSDENYVCPSDAWIVTKRKKNQSRFFIQYERSFSVVFREKRMIGGGDPFYLKLRVNRPPMERNRRFWTDIRS